MLYKFNTPMEYEQFLNVNKVFGAFSTLDMESFIPEVEKIKSGGVYVEVGVDKGKSLLTAFLAAQDGVNIVGVDINDTPERIEAFRLLGLEKYITFIHGESTNVAQMWRRGIDLLFIDGDHSYEGCLADIEHWQSWVKKSGVILFHDCDESSPGVVQAANEFFKGKVKLFKTPDKNTSMAKVVV